MTRTHATPDSIPLNLLDELFLGLDHGEEPWNVHVEARAGGRLDSDPQSQAIRAAAARHPLMRASLASWHYHDRGYRWDLAPELGEVPLQVVAAADEAEVQAARERIMGVSPSLENAPPFDLLLASGPDGDSVVLNVHHAAIDGVGAMRLLRAILCEYASTDDPCPDVDPLAVRDVRALAGAASLAERMTRARALARHAARQWDPPTRVARDGGSERPGYGFDLHALSAKATKAIVAACPPGATVNDVLLATLAVTIHRWNSAHDRRTGRVTLSMPINLRPKAWRDEVIGNFASYVTVSLTSADTVDLPRAVGVVAGQTRTIKRDGLGGLVVDLLVGPSRLTIAAKRRLPDLIPLTGNVVVDSAGLSNLGQLDALPPLGDAGRVEALWFSPPGRMPLGAAIGASTYGGRLHLTLRYRHAQFDRPGAAAFAALFRDNLTATDHPPASNQEEEL